VPLETHDQVDEARDTTPVKISIAWRVVAPETSQTGLKLPILDRDALTAEQAKAFGELHAGTSTKSSRVVRGAGAVAVQMWLDLPEGCKRSDDRVREALERASSDLCHLACSRQSAIAPELEKKVETWIEKVSGAAAEDLARTARSDGDVLVTVLEQGNAAMVGLDNRLHRSSGWEDIGASLMIAVGADRYGIRVRPPGKASERGEVPFANEPFRVRTSTQINALAAACKELAEKLAKFEARVTAALTSTSERDVRGFLGEAQQLLARRSTLEHRAGVLTEARDKLTVSWRKEAFALEDHEAEEKLRRLDTRLGQLRTELVDIPQLLLAAGSWRQAARTEALSLVAAGLVPPTLVAGALGANVLPWDDPTNGRPLIGMLVVMAASAVAAIVLVRWFVFGISPAWDDATSARRVGRAAWRTSALLAVIAGLIAGTWCLLDGTSTRRGAGAGNAQGPLLGREVGGPSVR
jgi:hypothetical protein